jgi:hypothetical protein
MPGNLPPSKCSSSSGLSMNEPFGSIILRTSQDGLRSSHATWIAKSRDRAARDCASPPRSAKLRATSSLIAPISFCTSRCLRCGICCKRHPAPYCTQLPRAAYPPQCVRFAALTSGKWAFAGAVGACTRMRDGCSPIGQQGFECRGEDGSRCPGFAITPAFGLSHVLTRLLCELRLRFAGQSRCAD